MIEHHYDAGERVTVFQMSPRDGLFIEGRATIVKRIEDVDEYYEVRFDNNEGDDDTYPRFIDWQGQENPEQYVRDFNCRIGK